MRQNKMIKMHYIQKYYNSILYSILHETGITADCGKSLYARDLSTITIPPTRGRAGGCGTLLRALPAPACTDATRAHGTTRCRVGPITSPVRK